MGSVNSNNIEWVKETAGVYYSNEPRITYKGIDYPLFKLSISGEKWVTYKFIITDNHVGYVEMRSRHKLRTLDSAKRYVKMHLRG